MVKFRGTRADCLAIACFDLYYAQDSVVRQLGDALFFSCVMVWPTHDLLLLATTSFDIEL